MTAGGNRHIKSGNFDREVFGQILLRVGKDLVSDVENIFRTRDMRQHKNVGLVELRRHKR